MINRLLRWFDDRLGASTFARSSLDKVFPDHWSFMLGEIAMYCFAILVLTGIYLSFFFVPSDKTVVYHGSYGPLRGVEMSQAYESTIRLSFDVRAGPRDAPDAPLGGTGVRGDDRRPPVPHLLHRRVPSAARDQLDRSA